MESFTNTLGGGLSRLSVFFTGSWARGVGVRFSGVRTGVTVGVWLREGRGIFARSWMREVKSRMRLVVDEGVSRFRLPDVVSVTTTFGSVTIFLDSFWVTRILCALLLLSVQAFSYAWGGWDT